MKKRIVALLCSMLILGVFLSYLGFEKKALASTEHDTSLQVLVKQTYAVDWNFYSGDKQDVIDIVKQGGWEYNNEKDYFERFLTYDDTKVEVEGQDKLYVTDTEGNVQLTSDKDTNNVSVIIPGLEEEPLTTEINFAESENTIIQELSIPDMIESAEKLPLESEDTNAIRPFASSTDPYWSIGERGTFGKRLHCNRFNGKYGDYSYYPNYYPQALINFTDSDCDYGTIASGQCWRDYGSDPYCAAYPSSKQAMCSRSIGHNTVFHGH